MLQGSTKTSISTATLTHTEGCTKMRNAVYLSLQKGGMYMTANELRYWELQEAKRANAEKEAHNTRALAETHRDNVERASETKRHNVITEGITDRFNTRSLNLTESRDAETRRSNLAREAETVRSAKVKEAETERANRAKEAETRRDNLAQDAIDLQKNKLTAEQQAYVRKDTDRKFWKDVASDIIDLGAGLSNAAQKMIQSGGNFSDALSLFTLL